MKFQDWMTVLDCHVKITGAIGSPTNTFINAHIKQNGSPYNELVLVDSRQLSLFGRDVGTIDNSPSIEKAIQNLKDQIMGKQVTFWRGSGRGDCAIYNCPQFDD